MQISFYCFDLETSYRFDWMKWMKYGGIRKNMCSNHSTSINRVFCLCLYVDKMVSIKEFSYVSYRFQEQLFEIASFIDQITDYIQFSVYGINQTTKMYLRTIIMLWFVESTTESRNWIPIWLTTRSTREYSLIRK